MDKQAEIKKAVDSIVKVLNPIVAEIVKRFESMLESKNEKVLESETVPLNILLEKSISNGVKEVTISLYVSDNEGYVLHKSTEFLNPN